MPDVVSPMMRATENVPAVSLPVVASVPADVPFTVRCVAVLARPVTVRSDECETVVTSPSRRVCVPDTVTRVAADSKPTGVVRNAASSGERSNELVICSAHAAVSTAAPPRTERSVRYVSLWCLPKSRRSATDRPACLTFRTSRRHLSVAEPYPPGDNAPPGLPSAPVRKPGGEMVTQLLQRATHPCLHALDRNSEQLRDLIVREAARSVHLKDLALRLR